MKNRFNFGGDLGLRRWVLKALHSLLHIVKLLQSWLIKTEGKMRGMNFLGQGGLLSECFIYFTFYHLFFFRGGGGGGG